MKNYFDDDYRKDARKKKKEFRDHGGHNKVRDFKRNFSHDLEGEEKLDRRTHRG